MTVMRAIALTGEGKVDIKTIEKPRPGKGEVLVKLKACALCTWEQRIFKGIAHMPLPFIGGHEASGIIEELGEDVNDNRWRIGQKVTLRLLYNCGECYYCRIGEHNLCEMIGKKGRSVLSIPGPGGLSEYIVVPSTQLYKIDDDLPFEIASLSEPLACVVHSIERANIGISDDVLVIGAGIMGILHMMVAKLKGARVVVSEVDEERRNLAKRLGADIVFNPLEENSVEKVKSITEGRGADVVINTTAISEIAQEATKLAGKTGRLIFYSSIHPDKPISISPDYVHNTEVNITGSVSPNLLDFQKSTRLLSFKIINPQPLISHIIPFEKAQEAFEKSITPGTYRVVIKINEE